MLLGGGGLSFPGWGETERRPTFPESHAPLAGDRQVALAPRAAATGSGGGKIQAFGGGGEAPPDLARSPARLLVSGPDPEFGRRARSELLGPETHRGGALRGGGGRGSRGRHPTHSRLPAGLVKQPQAWERVVGTERSVCVHPALIPCWPELGRVFGPQRGSGGTIA